MRDEDLRELERAMATGGPAARIPYANALERAGRAFDAVMTLARGVEAPEVRAELRRFPAWSEPDANVGRTRFLDAEPVRSPRIVWSRRDTGSGPLRVRAYSGFLASPFGVVPHLGRSELVVLDVETGESKLAFDAKTLWQGEHFFDEVLLSNPFLTAHDLRTKERIFVAHVPRHVLLIVDDGIITSAVDQSAVIFFAWTDRRRPPGIEHPIWVAPLPMPVGEFAPVSARASASREHIALGIGKKLFLLDRGDGRLLWTSEGGSQPSVDGTGVLSSFANEYDFAVLDLSGRTLWREGLKRTVEGVAPDFLVAAAGEARRKRLHTVERMTGKTIAKLEAAVRVAPAIVRDTVYAASPDGRALVAFSRDGSQRWRLPLQEISTAGIAHLAALPQRVFALLHDGTTICIGES